MKHFLIAVIATSDRHHYNIGQAGQRKASVFVRGRIYIYIYIYIYQNMTVLIVSSVCNHLVRYNRTRYIIHQGNRRGMYKQTSTGQLGSRPRYLYTWKLYRY